MVGLRIILRTMSETLRFAAFVTEADHVVVGQGRKKSRVELRNEARNRNLEALKTRMSGAQTKRDQQWIWASFGEGEERDLNVLLKEEADDLRSILIPALSENNAIDFDALRESREASVADAAVGSPPDPRAFETPTLSWFSRLFKSNRLIHESKAHSAMAEYEKKLREYQAKLSTARQSFEAAKASRNATVDEFERAYLAGEGDAVSCYCTLVLKRSLYPETIPRSFRTTFVGESSEFVIEAVLPTIDVIPPIESVSWVKSKHEFKPKLRKPAEVHKLYQELVAGIALRHLHEVFTADVARKVFAVVFNGYVNSVDRATGKEVRPCLISTRATRDQFQELNLAKVDQLLCLRNLGAQFSSKPGELVAVRPIVEFDMVDKRFVGEMDVMAELNERPNLMDLTPHEFEALVSNLFGKMGLETKLTRSSRDGGVDAVAFDKRPVLGGKVVIQAKRYSNTVGVAAVRDLYGTMMNEGANKGILVTTSGYGPDAFEFAKDKPIELISGGGLLYLLDQVGQRARIVFPEEAAVGV